MKNPLRRRPARDQATPEELHALFRIVSSISSATGEDFFDALLPSMAAALDVQYAFVSIFTEDAERMEVLAFWNGESVVAMGEYDMRVTPCSQLVDGVAFHCPRAVRDKFPKDRHLNAINAESYRGVPMIGPDGRHFGHVAVIDTKPMPTEPRFVTIMQLCATRSAAELHRIRAAAELRESEQRLDRVLRSAMDPIVTFDAERRVCLFNESAERVFALSAEEATRGTIDRFLAPELRDAVAQYVAGKSPPGWGDDSVWLPANAMCCRAPGEGFLVEGTLSRSGEGEYTLIIRDVNEREDALREIERLSQQREYLAEEIRRHYCFDHIIGESPALEEVMRQVERVAPTDATALLCGESGTGKELFARAIHARSSRSEKPLIKVDCASLPATLIESELFGHEKGAFTGADRKRIGRFELADGGTIFLDEIGELPLDLQPRLLRVLQDQQFERVGESTPKSVDVRVLAATNRDLASLVREGRFREDLYFRLAVFPIHLPPLRDRRGDVLPLAEHFAQAAAPRLGRDFERIESRSAARLEAYEWPGNVRELQNVVERALIMSSASTLRIDDPLLGSTREGVRADADDSGFKTLRQTERAQIARALEQSGGVIDGPDGAAAMLDINPSTLRSRMRKLDLRPAAGGPRE